jgi:CubicO group peptidase (beta-lactamase class C family)
MWSRRAFGQKLLGALFDRGPSLLRSMPGMLSAGFIARRGNTVRRRAEGQALVHGRWRSFELDQPFRVASVSKMVTATGFMSLVSQGRIDLDADVSRYLGETLRHPAFPETAITSRMLLSHTSGLRNGADFPVPFNRPLLARLREAAREENYGGWFAPAGEPPGRWFSYSDTNFAVLAQIIERVTQVRFDRFMRQTLFEPLNLDIGYNWSGVSQAKRNRASAACRWEGAAWTAQVDGAPPRAPEIALYRGENNDAAVEADYSIGLNGFAFAPHGGLRLSLADLDGLARNYLDAHRGDGHETLAQFLMTTAAWIFDPTAPNGTTERGWYQGYGLGVQVPLGRDAPGASPGDNFFGASTPDWRGHLGDAYGLMTGLFWNARENTTLAWAINGMPETDRPPGARSALSAPEENVIDAALSSLR